MNHRSHVCVVLGVFTLCALPHASHAAVRAMSLDGVVAMAKSDSRVAAQARDRYRSSLWQFRVQRASFLPTLALVGTAPDLTRSISKLSLPDGSEAFVRQSYNSSGLRLSIGKTIGSTGGEVVVETSLERLDLLDGTGHPTYLSTPLSVAVRQPLFAFNPHRWADRIEPLRLDEARRDYAEELEGIAMSAAQNFFDVVSAADQLETARENMASTDTLLTATRVRREAGKTSEDELLQSELASLNARLELQRAEQELRARQFGLRSYLGLRDTEEVRPQITFRVPEVTADVPVALSQARANRAVVVALQRRRLEAERDVAEARSQPGRSVDLFVSYGLNQSTTDLGALYDTGQEHERATLGIRVPILDWGRSYAHARLAESNAEVTMLSVEQAALDLEQDVIRAVLEFNVQSERIRIAAKADEVAGKRYAAAEQRYLSGDGDAAALNVALAEKDAARRAHVESLRGYWIAYFNLRRTTGYDFATRRAIDAQEPED
ncbi:MAG TPA: TolC family protein [Methylomirabilota bacterium]|nr:TolC family protein [Methylomirabilota bacterium]